MCQESKSWCQKGFRKESTGVCKVSACARKVLVKDGVRKLLDGVIKVSVSCQKGV